MYHQSSYWLALACVFGSATMSCSAGDESFSGEELADQTSEALILHKSYAPDATRNWYAQVKDKLYIDFKHVRVHNNGGPFKRSCQAQACVRVGDSVQCASAGPQSIGDATNIAFSSDAVIEVERNGCFTLEFSAKSTTGRDNSASASTVYCWDPNEDEWRRDSWGPGINRDESLYKKGSGVDFDVTWYWHIDWESTLVSGALEPKSNTPVPTTSGLDWHNLPPIRRRWLDVETTLTAELNAILGDTDLYAAALHQPEPAQYDCAPLNRGTADEFCSLKAADNSGVYFSVSNAGAQRATYSLLVKPMP